MKTRLSTSIGLAVGILALAPAAKADITVAPYVAVKSTKSINPSDKNKKTETEVVKQRQEAGLRVGIGIFRALKFEVSAGQSKLDTTQKVRQAKDEYDQIDYEKDLNMDVSDQEADVKVTETQNVGKASFILDPSFSIFILRARAGVIATQRHLRLEQTGQETTDKTFEPTYKPTLGAGAGVRLGRMGFFLAEYNFNLYKFPKYEPFEREVTVSFGISIGSK